MNAFIVWLHILLWYSPSCFLLCLSQHKPSILTLQCDSVQYMSLSQLCTWFHNFGSQSLNFK